MPFQPDRGFYQAPITIVDPSPDGDSVREGFEVRNTPAISQLYEDLNLLFKSGASGLPDGVTITVKDGIWSVASGSLVPSGLITLWSGAANAIPAGWALCNGQNNTPNLLDRFVVGAGSGYAVAATGGATSHQHGADFWTDNHTLAEWQMPNHHHTMPQGNGTHRMQGEVNGETGYGQGTYTNMGWAGSSGAHQHHASLGTDWRDNRPPYYALCYIMKL